LIEIVTKIDGVAEPGHFALAVSTAELAVDLAKKSGDKALPAQIESRLASYQQRRPVRDKQGCSVFHRTDLPV